MSHSTKSMISVDPSRSLEELSNGKNDVIRVISAWPYTLNDNLKYYSVR